jgi:hypothetical protein
VPDHALAHGCVFARAATVAAINRQPGQLRRDVQLASAKPSVGWQPGGVDGPGQ